MKEELKKCLGFNCKLASKEISEKLKKRGGIVCKIKRDLEGDFRVSHFLVSL